MVTTGHRILLASAALMLCFCERVTAQVQPDSAAATKTFIQKNFSLTGDVGAYGELYSMSGEQSRRPASTGRLYVRPTLTFFQSFSIPMEFFISTEGSGARQDINHYGIAPSWGWGKVSLGDFSETYSDLTLSGINIRGGGIDLYPGAFRFAVAGGITQREVEGGAENESQKRFLFAGKTGFGYEDGSHVYITVLKAKDEVPPSPNAVKALKLVFPNGSDEIPINTFQTIKWYTSGSTQSVNILISTNGGTSYAPIALNAPNTGFYNWHVVNVSESFAAVIKIVDAADSTLQTASEFPFRVGFGIDLKVGTLPTGLENSFAVTPQENLVIGVNTQVNVLGDMFKIGIEGVGSAYTRDLTADDINVDSVDIPSFVKSFYQPKTSTNVDYAINSFLNFSAGPVNAKAGYKYVGPGFTSLGLSYIINDQQEITGMASVNLFPVTVFMNYGRINDNVISQKAFTTLRHQYGAGVSAAATSVWTASAMANLMDMGNDSPNDTTRTDFTSALVSLNNNFAFTDSRFFKNLSVNYLFQNAVNSSFLMSNSSTAHSVNISVGFEPAAELASSFSAGIVSSTMMDSIKTFSQNYTLSSGYPMLNRKLQTSLSITASIQAGNTAFNLMLFSSLAVTPADYLTLQFGTNTFTTTTTEVHNFTEMRTSLNYSHRF